MLQNPKVTAFTISELFRENQQEGECECERECDIIRRY